jgi:transcriptional regulator with XRE-family HTH domain
MRKRSAGFDITQADVATRIGVSQSYLSAVEHGRNEIGVEVLLAISREFDPERELPTAFLSWLNYTTCVVESNHMLDLHSKASPISDPK